MKQRYEAYPFYDHDEDIGKTEIALSEPVFDNLLTTDRLEIDRIRWELERCLEDDLDFRRRFEEMPVLDSVALAIELMLIKTGFDSAEIKDPKRLYDLIRVMKAESWTGYTGEPPKGFPKNTFCVSDDKKQMWVLEGIEAALFALWSYYRLKAAFNSDINQPAAICSLTFQFILDAARTGIIRKSALAGKRQSKKQREAQANRKTWNGLPPEERERRDKGLLADFRKWKEAKKPANSFYENKARKHKLSPSAIRKIVNS